MEDKIGSSSDDDSLSGNEGASIGTKDIFKDYSQGHSRINIETPRYNEISDQMYYSNTKRITQPYSSSSDDDDNQQYSMTSHNQMGTSQNEDASRHINKKRKLNITNSNSNDKVDNDLSYIPAKTHRMMEKMGYHQGGGLGKYNQGRVEPIQPFMQLSRRGLGHSVPGLKEASLRWDPKEEEIRVKEHLEWLPNLYPHTLTNEDVSYWMELGSKKLTIEDETTFCDPETLTNILNLKTTFDKLDKVEMRKARTRSNPYETIRTAGFLNRAAVKMANIDKACDLMFTNPKDSMDELLYFADVCAGPGGFSEYVLSRKKWHAKGFGFTLKNENDFCLDEFFAGPCETFHPFYGSMGDGDVYNPKHQEEFRALVMKHTYSKGVHFMMSDGGFSVEGQENIQEILSKRLYLCQCLVALMIVRTGGHFVTKLFDVFTLFSAGLVYLMYRCFDSICIFKPNSSRPANSERYLICKGKRDNIEAIVEYLSNVNRLLAKDDKDNDVIQLVPLHELEADEAFIKYLKHSNDTLGKKQAVSLMKIAAFCEDTSLTEPKQADMRKECLSYWGLSEKTRTRPYNVKPQDKIREILNNSTDFITSSAQKLTRENVKALVNRPYDWYWIPCGSGQNLGEEKIATFYLGMGRTKVYRWLNGKWNHVGDGKLELPANTLVYAELIYDFKWMGKDFQKSHALHILDAYILGGEDVSKKYITHRNILTRKFCDALWKPTPHDFICVRAKKIFMFGPNVEKELRLSQRCVKSLSTVFEFPKNWLERDSDDDREPLYHGLNSVLFLKSTANPWKRHLSQKTNHFYVHNWEKDITEYEKRRPPEAEAHFKEAFTGRYVWHWPQDLTLNLSALVEMLKNL